jgi:tripartite-type tricarboxylate transporter receptor subunit TctC
VHVPYRGGPQATTDLIGGQYAMLFAISSSAKRLRGRACVNNSLYKASM